MTVEYRTLQEIVYDAIRDNIVSGRYRPGQRLRSDEVARELGVSRMPVREALHRLEVAGLVTIAPHRGAVVTQLSREEIIEIYRIRGVLEGLATQLAAAHLTRKDYEQLQTNMAEMAAAAQAKDIQLAQRLNHEYHLIIWRAAHAPRLLELLENLFETSQRFRNFSYLVPGHLEHMVQSHQRVADALIRGDVAAAERYAIEHHLQTIQYLLTVAHQGQADCAWPGEADEAGADEPGEMLAEQ